jgi:hypothetical protein
VTNNDTKQAADHAVITDPLPAGVSFVGASSECSNANGKVTCDVGTLGPGDVAEPSIKVTASQKGKLVNIAHVSADQPERNTRDNTAYATVTVQAAPEPTPTPKPDPNKGGGGAFGWLSLLWLGWAYGLLRRH